MTDDVIRAALRTLPSADEASLTFVSDRAAQTLRPVGALAALDDLAAWLGSWQHRRQPRVDRVIGLVFAADHGVAADGVSAYPPDITAVMMQVFQADKGSVNALARSVGATVEAVDVGVGVPTANFRHEPAMSPERFELAFASGRQAVADRADGCDLIVLGELGIGNTTAAAAVAAAMFGGTALDWVGRGTGVDDDGLARKRGAVDDGLERIVDVADLVERFRHVGGAELVAMAGAVVEARHRSIPVLLDGYVVAAAVAPLAVLAAGALDHCRVAHASAEPGHRRLLEHLGLVPLLDLGMRLGEASGAMVAVPLLRAACTVVNEVPTFAEWFAAAETAAVEDTIVGDAIAGDTIVEDTIVELAATTGAEG